MSSFCVSHLRLAVHKEGAVVPEGAPLLAMLLRCGYISLCSMLGLSLKLTEAFVPVAKPLYSVFRAVMRTKVHNTKRWKAQMTSATPSSAGGPSSLGAPHEDGVGVSPAAACPTTLPGRRVSSILTVGDGDFSFSCALMRKLPPNVSLTASVYLDRESLVTRYPSAQETIAAMESECGVSSLRVVFGVDARELRGTLMASEAELFDRIVYNFPHHPGKANIKANRGLVGEFLQSAASMLHPGGEVLLVLCEGQSGTEARDARAYKASWQLSRIGAEAGMVIASVKAFADRSLYNPTGRRDRLLSFERSKRALLHVLVRAGDAEAMYPPIWGHELHLLIPPSTALTDADVRGAVIEALGGSATASQCLKSVTFADTFQYALEKGGAEARAYDVRYASRCIALDQDGANHLRQRVEEGVPRVLKEHGVQLRHGKNGFSVHDVTWQLNS